MNSSEMIFTENELQILANALVVLLKFTENNGSDLENFVNISGLLNRMNAELDDIEFKRMQEMEEELNALNIKHIFVIHI